MLFGTNIKGAGKSVSIICITLQTAFFGQRYSFYIYNQIIIISEIISGYHLRCKTTSQSVIPVSLPCISFG